MNIIISIEDDNGIYVDWNYPSLPRVGENIENRLVKYLFEESGQCPDDWDEDYLFYVKIIQYDWVEDADGEDKGEILAIITLIREKNRLE